MLLPYTVLVRLHTLWHPEVYAVTEADTSLVRNLYSFLPSAVGQSIVAILLVFFQAWAINRLSIKFRIAKRLTLIPGLIYILFTAFFSELLVLTPVLMATTFVIWVLYELYSTYKRTHTAISLFNTGFAVGLATLLVPSMYLYMLLCVLGLTIIKTFKTVELLQQVIGFLVVLYLYYSFGHLIGMDVGSEWPRFSLGFQNGLFDITGFPKILGFLAAGIAISVFSYNKYLAKKSIQIHKSIDMLFWCLVIALLSTLFSTQLSFSYIVLAMLPLALLLNMNVQRIRNQAIVEILHIVLLAALFIQHFSLL